MSHISNKADEELMLKRLREILLSEDRQKLAELKAVLEERQKLAEKVDPIVEEHITFLKNNFPVEFQNYVDDQIKYKLEESQEEILNVIYPVLGKMIKKYIAQQFQMLKESIDQRVRGTFSSKGVIGRIKASLFGVKDSEIILSSIDIPKIMEVFIIEHNSGLLLGSASRQNTVDQDVVAGMLTAIKAFVEDAFMGGEQNLGMIEYDTSKILIQNFPSYYVALALSGSISSAENDKISSEVFDFAENSSIQNHIQPSEEGFEIISKELEKHFFDPVEIIENTENREN